jgi:hypothetical protein
MSIKYIPFSIVVSPLVSAYKRGNELQRRLGRIIPENLVEKASNSEELLALVNKELEDFDLGIPLRALFVDAMDGTITDAEYAIAAVMIIIVNDGTDRFQVTLH